MTKDETQALLSMLGSLWTSEEIDDGTIAVWHLALEPFPFEAMVRAGAQHMRASKFFPKPAELIDLMLAELAPQLSQGEAWEIVGRQIGKHGSAGQPMVRDPAVAAAIQAVGWKRLCLDDAKTVRPLFEKALTAAQQR